MKTKDLPLDENMIAKKGCVATASGYIFDLFNINPDYIFIEDIATGLSNNCRWNGQTNYTVAQHCCEMYDNIKSEYKMEALFHDAEEAYWGDIIRPIKLILKEISEGEKILGKMIELRKVIFDKFGIRTYGSTAVKNADNEVMKEEYQKFFIDKKSFGIWDNKRAYEEWIWRFKREWAMNELYDDARIRYSKLLKKLAD